MIGAVTYERTPAVTKPPTAFLCGFYIPIFYIFSIWSMIEISLSLRGIHENKKITVEIEKKTLLGIIMFTSGS